MPLRYLAEVNTDDFIPDRKESSKVIFQGKSTQTKMNEVHEEATLWKQGPDESAKMDLQDFRY